jgi:Asp-tRNA(Asn)/Glu-tRNA(Gln) amidotransferase A subunit family amidase
MTLPTHPEYWLAMDRYYFSKSRREFLSICSAAGVGSTFFAGTLFALAVGKPQEKVTIEMIDQAAALAGIHILPDRVETLLSKLNEQRRAYAAIRLLHLPNDVPPAFRFDPFISGQVAPAAESAPVRMAAAPGDSPVLLEGDFAKNPEKLAFATVRQLGALLRSKKVSVIELTEIYLARLKRFNPQLHFLVTLTEERARTQAAQLDAELASGRDRGPLHGIPWGAKDLLAVRGYPTTWGAGGFQQQAFSDDAMVVQRLDEAGAVLVAKLSLGALAMGDKWFGGRTRNPWNASEGSSGSSAGSASATAAGCVAFAIGSETLGSISSPSTRCGTSGFRPTFGFVPRTGAMALAWTMDKLGPICRAAEDCALVMQSIYGPDGLDANVRPAPFLWDPQFDWKQLRIGYAKELFEEQPPSNNPPENATEAELKQWESRKEDRASAGARREYDRAYDLAALTRLRAMGVDLQVVRLPDLPLDAISLLLNAEAAAAFDDLTLTGRDELLTEQGPDDWPNLFRAARFYPAVEYIQANRARTVAMQQMAKLFEQVDIIVVPSSSDAQLILTNLTGHPAVIVPNGIRGKDAPQPPSVDTGEDDSIGGPGTPVSLTFLGRLYHDSALLAFASAYQQATGFHHLHPPGFD